MTFYSDFSDTKNHSPDFILVDGSTTNVAGDWPTLSYNLVTIAGANNTLPSPIYMVKLDTQNKLWVGDQDVVYTHPNIPGMEMEIKAGSATFPDGAKQGYITISPVNSNKVPMPPPNGMQPQLAVTIQPTGTMFDPPARFTMPNMDGLAPGAQIEMISYDHDLEQFVTIGLGTVSRDGSVIKTNPGVGIIKAGWHATPPLPPEPSCSAGGPGGGCGSCMKNASTTCGALNCVVDVSNTPAEGCSVCNGDGSIAKVSLTNATATANGKTELVIPLEENGTTVNFTAQGVGENCNSYSYEWDFGNGQTSSQQNPNITFSEPGVYDTKVVVKCESCDAQEKVVDLKVTVFGVVIDDPLEKSWTISSVPSMPNDIQFTAKLEPAELLNNAVFYWSAEFHSDVGGFARSYKIPQSGFVTISNENIWKPDFSGKIVGATDITVNLMVSINSDITNSATVKGFSILGSNPTKEQIMSIASTDIHRAVIWTESSFKQFDAPRYAGTGFPYYGPPDGFGLAQLDPPPTIFHMWNWEVNLRDGVSYLTRLRSDAQNYLNTWHDKASATEDPSDDWLWNPHYELPELVWNDAFSRYNTGKPIFSPNGNGGIVNCERNPSGCVYYNTVRTNLSSRPWN